MAIDPWTYAKTSEHSHQAALFQWANMACRFGLTTANNLNSYLVKGFAQNCIKNDQPIPQLKWLHAIHNQGHGDAIRGGKAKAEGVKAGVADIFLPVPIAIHEHKYVDEGSPGCSHYICNVCRQTPLEARMQYGGFNGLYIELKVGNNKPDAKQLDFQVDMRAAGYASEIAYGWLDARKKILDYLSISC